MNDTEAKANGGAPLKDERQPRQPLQSTIEFIGDFDVVQAVGVDLSEGGLGFEIDQPLAFELRYVMEGVVHQRRVQLTWVRLLEQGHCRCGFRFAEPVPSPVL